MRRRGLRKETADLDKKIWDWSLTEPSASATKIRKFAKTLFCEAGYENFKASECWYRRWRNRWRNHSDKKDEASNDPTELKHDSTENKLPKRNSARMKRRNSEDTKDCIDNTGIPSKRPNPGEGSSDKTDNLQISSCSENDKLFSNDDDQNNRTTIEIEKQVGIPSDKLSLNRSVDQENDVVFSLIEFRNISTKSGTQDNAVEFNSQYCSQLGISDNTPLLMDSEHIASSSSIRKDRFCLETLMPEINICSLDGISDVNPLKTHEEDSRSSLQELQNKIVDTTTLMEEIDSRLGQISDECCFKNQTNVPFSLINESNISIRDCETIEVNRNNEAYLEENGMSASNSKAENSYNHAVNNLNDKIDPFSCGSAKPLTVSSDITSQVMNCESFCINENVKNTIQFENFLDISNESIFPNFSEANFEDKTYGTDQSNKTPNEIVNRSTENFVDIYSDSEFPSFPLSDIGEDNTTDKSNKLFSELKSVGLDLCGKDQHSLELMKVINDHLNENAENSVSSDNLDACLMSAEFQIPGLSLGSEEIFEFYRNSLFMESNYMFCESCDDFHMNEIEACEDVSNYEEVLSLKGPDSESQTKSSEQESVSKNEEESNKETDLCSTDGDGSDKQAKQGESSNGQKERKKHERYLPKFKSKVAAYAKSHSIRAAALKFNLYYGSVADWTHEKMRKDKEQDFKPYKESESIKVEEQFLNWLKSMRESKKPVNQPLIRGKLQDLIKPEVSLEKITEKWLKHYLERLKNEDVAVESNQMVNDKKTSKKYVYHSLSFKREVALYAEMFSQKAASRDFGIARRRVGEWMKSAKTNSQEQHGSEELGKRDCSKYVADATIDRDILDWYKSQSVPPTSKQVREMGLKLYADGGYDVSCSSGWWRRWSKRHQVRREAMSSLDNHILEFVLSQLDRNVKVSHADLIEYVSKINKKSSSKVSSGWVIRFCKRYPTLLQRTPQFNTNLPPAMELKVLSFRKRIQKLIGDFKLTGSEIGTIDEIPLRFTDTGTSLKQQLIRNSGFDNCQASLVVSCLANGRLLPSIVIVKGSKPEDLIMSNKEVMVFVRENSCLDSDIFMHWIKHIWPMFQTQETSILVSNNFHPYKDAKAREELSAVSCKHEFFPPGCLSKLQPIRIALSTAFQDGLYNFWKKKMKKTSWDHELSINLPSHRVIFGWTTKIHKKIAATFQEEIASSFKKTLLAECEEKSVHDNTIESIIQQTHNQTESSNKTVID